MREFGRFEEYSFFDHTDYRSWSGIELAIQIKEKKLTVSTRTPIARSYYDLTHQNHTISSLKRRFGGTFETDEGKGRYLRAHSGPPPPAASGAHLAFDRFGGNLIRASVYLEARTFPVQKGEALFAAMGMSPRVVSNNLLVPFLVAALEDFFRSAFVALLRYSPRKLAFLKNVRLTGER